MDNKTKAISEQIKPISEFDLNLTPRAYDQIKLIQDNDYTVEDKIFRVQISGKGCSGFNYDVGFAEEDVNDVKIPIWVKEKNLHFTLHLDPFTAFYFYQGTLDYQLDIESGEDGFVVMNTNEQSYFGKFFKDESLVPKI
ncbi:MAG: HesB/IscA family protein [Bacteriovoracaceae bacterium]